MPSRRLLLTCTGVSVLLHLLVLLLAYLFPVTVRRPEEVMEIDLSDIPRATDFLPPRPGILSGRSPRPVPPPEARKLPPAPPVMEGRVPDLPVKPDLPPEKSFPVESGKPEPGPDSKSVAKAQTPPAAPPRGSASGSPSAKRGAPPPPRRRRYGT